MQPNSDVPESASFIGFCAELDRLVEQFGRNINQYRSNQYDEASLRQEFLNPLLRALGWDIENKAGLIPQHREVEIESRTEIAGRQKRADYLFRTDRRDRFICEAKKPAEVLHSRYVFQAKRYAWNKSLVLAVLTDFEEMLIYVVGSKPRPEEVKVGLWKTWRYQQYPLVAQEIWGLLARSEVAGGSIERLVDQLPRTPVGKGRARQQWLFKPDRSRALDTDFLNFLDDSRRELASDLLRHNNREDLLEGVRLNEAVQRILDRLLFLRICEDRDIDTGRPLASILRSWRSHIENPVLQRVRQSDFLESEDGATDEIATRPSPYSLWGEVVAHFRALDRRPPSHIPFFNGNIFKPHFSEELAVSDEWIAGFLDDVGDEESPYLFNVIPVEILGIIYERFLGKVVRPKGRGVTIEEKPEVRKAGGVYYTPRYIVDYIVEQTVGKLLADLTPQQSLKLHVLDPSCGSGSFLIRAYERICEHWVTALMKDVTKRRRSDCWTDPDSGDVHLTTDLKRRILTANIHGVDIDPGAVEVTQLSLYLKMLEGENRTSLARERDLFGSDIALLPPLETNIKCGNSLIASDFSLVPDDLVRVKAFDWTVQFPAIMKTGGFDAVIGNPPYIRIQTLRETDSESVAYINSHFVAAAKGNYDIYVVFVERALSLLNKRGLHGFILPHKFFNAQYGEALRKYLAAGNHVRGITHFGHQQVFEGATTYTCLVFTQKSPSASLRFAKVDDLKKWADTKEETVSIIPSEGLTEEGWIFAAGPAGSLLDRLRHQHTTLENVADRIFQGLKTSADKIYIVEERKRRGNYVLIWSPEKQAEYWLEADLLHPLIKGGDSRRYILSKTKRLILFPYQKLGSGKTDLIPGVDIRKRFPKTWLYLKDNKKYLEAREDGKMIGPKWYGYIYPKALDVMPLPKLFTPDLAACASFSLDETGDCFFTGGVSGGYGILPKFGVSPKVLLGLLNSRLLNWIVSQIGTQMRGGYLSFEARFIRLLPIAQKNLSNPADLAWHDRIVGLVDKMLALSSRLRTARTDTERATLQNALTATDRQIDALVYELYGLTLEEIDLVEKT
jgi:hypothetical protein